MNFPNQMDTYEQLKKFLVLWTWLFMNKNFSHINFKTIAMIRFNKLFLVTSNIIYKEETYSASINSSDMYCIGDDELHYLWYDFYFNACAILMC